MSVGFGTTPTAEDLAAARTKLAVFMDRRKTAPAYAREATATLVAIELGVIASRLFAATEIDAALAAQARALYSAWMEE
jgi:hypothetical protein